MGGACGAYVGGERRAQGSGGETWGKETIGETQTRWEDNIKMDLQEVGGTCGDWMELAQDRDRWRALVGTVRNLRVPKMRGISWLAAEPVSFSRTLLHGVSKYIALCIYVCTIYYTEKNFQVLCHFFVRWFRIIWMTISESFAATTQLRFRTGNAPPSQYHPSCQGVGLHAVRHVGVSHTRNSLVTTLRWEAGYRPVLELLLQYFKHQGMWFLWQRYWLVLWTCLLQISVCGHRLSWRSCFS